MVEEITNEVNKINNKHNTTDAKKFIFDGKDAVETSVLTAKPSRKYLSLEL